MFDHNVPFRRRAAKRAESFAKGKFGRIQRLRALIAKGRKHDTGAARLAAIAWGC